MTKIILVTGASSGIGEETARALAAAGHTVYGAARRLGRLTALAEHGIRPLALDVTDENSTASAVREIVAQEGRIDVLINNAGYGSYGAVEDVDIDEAKHQFEVNLFGLARLVQLVLPHMRAQGSGRIINLSSIGGKIYEPFGAWYHATKFAVEGFSDSLRLELAPYGIDVVIIEPGPITTEWNTIARDKLQEASGNTAYADRARAFVAFLKRVDESNQSSPPSVVAHAILRAVQAQKPRTRYPAGKGAASIIAARRMLPDRGFDRLMNRLIAG